MNQHATVANLKDSKPRIENAIQTSSFNSSNDLKSSMFNIVQKVLDEVLRLSGALTLSGDDMYSLVQTKPITTTSFKSVQSNTRFIVLIAETVAKIGDGAVH